MATENPDEADSRAVYLTVRLWLVGDDARSRAASIVAQLQEQIPVREADDLRISISHPHLSDEAERQA